MKPIASLAILLALLAAALAPISASRRAIAYPQPEVVPTIWLLDFSFDQPRLIPVADLRGNLRWYWYLTYKVVNNTQAEQLLIPEFSIATDRGDILEAFDGVPSNVFDAIKAEVGNDLLENPTQMIGRILRGQDHARESVAVWPAFEHDVDLMSVFVAGLSGETRNVPHPVTGEPIVMRRTLMLDFATPGTTSPSRAPLIHLQSRRWVMR